MTAMADAFFFEIDWTTVAMVVGIVISIIVAVFFYGRRDLN
jgi:hypothetical protein